MALIVGMSFVACKDNPVEQYGTGLISAKKQAENTAVYTNLSFLQQSVQNFRAVNSRNPESLEELRDFAKMDLDISQYDYDPATGHVTIKQ